MTLQDNGVRKSHRRPHKVEIRWRIEPELVSVENPSLIWPLFLLDGRVELEATAAERRRIQSALRLGTTLVPDVPADWLRTGPRP